MLSRHHLLILKSALLNPERKTASRLLMPLPNELMLLSLVAVAGGFYCFIRGFRLLARKRLLLNTPASKIRSASLGLVEVSGVATGPYTLPAPISEKLCFLYRTTAWQKSEESKTGEWKKVAEESLHVPFFVDDSTGQLLIEPSGAELDLHLNYQQNFSDTIFSPHATPQVLSFLARHGVEPSSKIRIEECSIEPQLPLFIVGTLAENPGIEVGPNTTAAGQKSENTMVRAHQPPAAPQEVVRLSPIAMPASTEDMSQQSKIAAALSKAGIASAAAWQPAVVRCGSAVQEAGARVEKISINVDKPSMMETPFNLTPPVVLMKGENNPAFLISWRSQKDLVRRLAWKSAAMIWCGGALTLLALYVLLQQFELL